MKKNWHVVDWANNVMYGDKRFDSFEDARGYISEMAERYAPRLARDASMPKYPVTEEEAIEGYCEDMYAEEVDA